LQFFNFISKFKPQANIQNQAQVPELSYFYTFHSKQFIQLSFEFLNQNSVNFVPLHLNIYFQLLVNGDFIIDVLDILSLSVLFIQESFQVLESDVHEVNKKIQLED